MPEGPEIRQAADEIAQILEGKVIESAALHHDTLSSAKRYIVGEKVTQIECHGKALLTHFSSGRTIYSHNQLYGIWCCVPRDQLPQTNRVLRLALHTKDNSALLYSATDISLWKTSEVRQHPFLQRLGPDVLAKDTNFETVLAQLNGPKFRNRQLATLYLDQGFIAGLGNYLRSEILLFAGVHPTSKPSELDSATLLKLAKTTLSISQRTYRTRGLTLPPKLMPKARSKNGRVYEPDRFAVFAREAMPCRVCETPIERGEMTSRRIYWCPTCQPLVTKRKG